MWMQITFDIKCHWIKKQMNYAQKKDHKKYKSKHSWKDHSLKIAKKLYQNSDKYTFIKSAFPSPLCSQFTSEDATLSRQWRILWKSRFPWGRHIDCASGRVAVPPEQRAGELPVAGRDQVGGAPHGRRPTADQQEELAAHRETRRREVWHGKFGMVCLVWQVWHGKFGMVGLTWWVWYGRFGMVGLEW